MLLSVTVSIFLHRSSSTSSSMGSGGPKASEAVAIQSRETLLAESSVSEQRESFVIRRPALTQQEIKLEKVTCGKAMLSKRPASFAFLAFSQC